MSQTKITNQSQAAGSDTEADPEVALCVTEIVSSLVTPINKELKTIWEAVHSISFMLAKNALLALRKTCRHSEMESRIFEPRDYGVQVYKEHHLVKWFCRIFTRYNRLARRYNAFSHLASTWIWLC